MKSHLDERMLKKIAAVTGGMYQPLGQRGEGLTAIYSQGLAPFQRHDVASRQQRVYLEQFQWPLLLALCCFLAELFIGTRKRLRRAAEAPVSKNAVRFALRRPKPAAPTAAAGVDSCNARVAWFCAGVATERGKGLSERRLRRRRTAIPSRRRKGSGHDGVGIQHRIGRLQGGDVRQGRGIVPKELKNGSGRVAAGHLL